MLTLIPFLNPPRARRGKIKKKSTRKPARETSTTSRPKKRRKAREEVAKMAKKRRKRGRGGRFVSTKKRGRRRSRRRNPVAVNPPRRRRRRRRNPTVLVRRGRRYRRLVSAPKVYTRRTRGKHKGSLRRLNPRRRRRSRRRRNPVVIVRRGRRLKSYGKHRRVYTRRRRGKHKGTIRRMNPRHLQVAGLGLNLDTGIQVISVAGGVVLNQLAPGLIAQISGKDALRRGWTGVGVGLVASGLVATGVAMIGQKRLARNLAFGAAVGIGVDLVRMAVGKLLGSRARTAAPAASAQSGMGALVSPEAMIETQALLNGMGDFVQLSGSIPRGDFAGMGDYVEFGSQAAGANALAAQLAPQQVFSPGADEKF